MALDNERQQALHRCADALQKLYKSFGYSASDIVYIALELIAAEQAEKGEN